MWVERFSEGWEVIRKPFGRCRDGSSCLTRLMTTQFFFSELLWILGVLGPSSSGSTVDLSPERTTSCFGSRLNGQAIPFTSSKFHFLLREQYTRTSSYSGQPFIFNMIHTFGGQVTRNEKKIPQNGFQLAMFGRKENINNRPEQVV